MKALFTILLMAFLVYVVGLPRLFLALDTLDVAAKQAYTEAEQAVQDARAARARRARGLE